MSNLDDRLNAIISQGSDTLQIEDEYTLVPTVTEVPITEYEIVPSKNIQEPMTDYDDDYILTRTTLRGVLGRATGILDVAIINAVNTENPKYVDSVTSLISAVRGVTKELMDIHGKGSSEKEQKLSVQPTVTINNFAKEKDEMLTVLDTLPDNVVDVDVSES